MTLFTIRQSSIDGIFADYNMPDVILCGAVQYAMIKAHIDFQGRDRRRIKREVNKAAKRAGRQKQ